VTVRSVGRQVLLVEADDADAEAVARAFAGLQLADRLVRTRSAEAALELLEGRLDAPETLPGLVLADLELPDVNAISLLRTLRDHPRLRSLPLVVYSSSASPRAVAEAYAAGVGGYLVKPLELADLQQAIRRLADYWLDLVEPPSTAETTAFDADPLHWRLR
jgi:CheY-like chemotaxis protein